MVLVIPTRNSAGIVGSASRRHPNIFPETRRVKTACITGARRVRARQGSATKNRSAPMCWLITSGGKRRIVKNGFAIKSSIGKRTKRRLLSTNASTARSTLKSLPKKSGGMRRPILKKEVYATINGEQGSIRQAEAIPRQICRRYMNYNRVAAAGVENRWQTECLNATHQDLRNIQLTTFGQFSVRGQVMPGS